MISTHDLGLHYAKLLTRRECQQRLEDSLASWDRQVLHMYHNESGVVGRETLTAQAFEIEALKIAIPAAR